MLAQAASNIHDDLINEHYFVTEKLDEKDCHSLVVLKCLSCGALFCQLCGKALELDSTRYHKIYKHVCIPRILHEIHEIHQTDPQEMKNCEQLEIYEAGELLVSEYFGTKYTSA